MRAATTGLLALSATFAGCAALGPAPISPTPSILVAVSYTHLTLPTSDLV